LKAGRIFKEGKGFQNYNRLTLSDWLDYSLNLIEALLSKAIAHELKNVENMAINRCIE